MSLEEHDPYQTERKAFWNSLEPTQAEADAFAVRTLVKARRARANWRWWRNAAGLAACLAMSFSAGWIGRAHRPGDVARVQPPMSQAGYRVELTDEAGRVQAVQDFQSPDEASRFAGDVSRWRELNAQRGMARPLSCPIGYKMRSLAMRVQIPKGVVRCFISLGTAMLVAAAQADEPTPLLIQLNKETQTLYRNVQDGVARVQLPTPRWLKTDLAVDNPAQSWPQLNEAMKQTLQGSGNLYLYGRGRTSIAPATQPTGQAIESTRTWQVQSTEGGVVMQSTGANGAVAINIGTGGTVDGNSFTATGGLQMSFQPAASFMPNNVGVVTDNAGHLLVPLYVEKDDVPDGVKASVGQGAVVKASFVGSDRKSMLSVFKLPESTGKPVKVGARRPVEGSLVMTVSANAATSRLILWAGDKSDITGVVVSVDGGVNGFARGAGQFVSVSSCRGVVDELVRYGKVKRAELGLQVLAIIPDDAARERWPALGARPALNVQDVTPGSIAQKGGIHTGDLILTFGDDEVGSPNDLASALAGRGGAVRVELLRGGKPVELTVDLPSE